MSGPSFQKITVAVDGSKHANEALDTAVDLAKHYSSSLTIVGIAPIVPVLIAPAEPLAPGMIPPSDLPRYRDIVDAAVKHAKGAGVTNVSGVASEGVVVDELLEHLEAHPADLVVVGSRGLSTAKRILLGSVSSGLVNHAPCPVLVVRPVAATKHGG
jgi:nucleotide-binding universal stress UspA family protein